MTCSKAVDGQGHETVNFQGRWSKVQVTWCRR